MSGEAEQPLTVFAKGLEADGERSAVGPEELVTFERDVVLEAVAGRVASKQYR
jgi:hypothetical protein